MAYGKIRVDTLTWDNSGTPTDVTISALPTAANPTFTGAISLNAQGDFRYYDSDSSNYVGFQAPGTVSSNVLWTLPGADGSSGQQLSTDGSGTLSWSDATNVQAASLTGTTMAANVVASSLTSVGTLSSLTIDGDVTFTGASSNGLWDKSADAFVADLTGTASIATTVTVADESSDTTCFPLFATAATGNLGPKSGTNLTFNASSGALTATSFVGALTGNVTGNASGSSGSCTGNAATASLATEFTVTANNSTNETVYPLFSDGATGSQGAETDTGLTYNPDTGRLTAGSFGGAFIGNASTATALYQARNIGGVAFDGSAAIDLPGVNTAGNQDTTGTAALATQFTVSANNSTNETVYPIFVDGATGSQGGETDTGLSYNPSTGALSSTSFVGALTGNVTGNTSGSSGSCTGNAASATYASAVTVADESSDTSCFPLFASAATGNLDVYSGSNLTFNSSNGMLTASAFSGDGSSITDINASNITSGTLAAARVATLNQDTTGNAATADGVDTTASTTNASHYLTFVDSSSSSAGETIRMESSLIYNPSTKLLTVPELDIKKTQETYQTVTHSSSGGIALDFSNGNIIYLNQGANITTAVGVTNCPSGKAFSFTIVRKNTAGSALTIAWGSAYKWPSGGTAPTLTNTSNAIDILTFITFDGGSTIYSIKTGTNFA